MGVLQWIRYAVEALAIPIFIYILLLCSFYIILFLIAFSRMYRENEVNLRESYTDLLQQTGNVPPLSILVPAYNEELVIRASVLSLLDMYYPLFEVIVINDGSKDATMQVMLETFEMEKTEHVVRRQLNTKEVRGIYRSARFSNLLLIDKENGGKADALNAGINASRYPYFCSLDGDSILEKDALANIMKPVLESREEVIAVGGSVRIANGSVIEKGEVKKISLPDSPIVVMQIIEYIRAFLIGRLGLSRYNILPIISGAFGIFNKAWIVRAGGYREKTVGEDMELIVRLHRLKREQKSRGRILYVPKAICLTEAPDTWKILKSQRTRWHRGLYESLWLHKAMLFNPRYGGMGLVAMPYFLIVELLGPLIEFTGYVFVVIDAIVMRGFSEFVIMVFIVGALYGSFLSAAAVLLENWGVRNYPRIRDLTKLFVYALSESFWYRPVTSYWRLIATFQAIRGKTGWGEMKRKGVIK
ncbi:glycosyltransferase family 2 protein [Ectobacillus ponti]|uniref:Glycosyltransferase n=1 Tax=Ectobacillus ponti TaxID=2961894 RepID=A0AA41XA03_9BACI|nr:glycosyltransferase [Ectobacillus ponti]MCP8969454.1 glycosyltransferase [Ectobacillus ponti]